MSAEAAHAWIKRHVENIDRVRLGDNKEEHHYEAIGDLKEAVLGAAIEVNEAEVASQAPNLVAALYTVIGRMLPTDSSLLTMPKTPSWFERLSELYNFGLDILGNVTVS
jgi:hypothetical protein